MALINCPECNREISDTAKICPHCGCKPARLMSTATPQPKKKRAWLGIVIAVSIVAILAIVAALIVPSISDDGKTQNFKERYLGIRHEYWAEVADDGSWLKVTASSYSDDAFVKIREINSDLSLSATLYEKMISTREIDGSKSFENETVSVLWRYADQTLEVTYALKNPSEYRIPDEKTCQKLEKAIKSAVSFDDKDTIMLITPPEEGVDTSIRFILTNKSTPQLVEAAVELSEELPVILKKFKVADYFVLIHATSDEKNYTMWLSYNLESGHFAIIKDGESAVSEEYTLAELQELYS